MEKPKTSNLIIYYFSGTGNARNVAYWIKNVFEQNNINSQYINISKLEKGKKPNIPSNSLVGFVSPTHGFNFPPIMFNFLLKFPKANNQQVFIINTRGGMKLGKWFLPGLSGVAQYFFAIVMKIKQYKIVGMHPIDLPSNWISIHPGLKENVIESIYQKRKLETEQFAIRMINGKTDYKALRDIVQDLLISPVSVLYYFFGRFLFAKSFIASSDCNNCNLCIKQCPVNAIKLVGNKPFWTYKCESCMQCMNSCRQRAIQTSHGFIVGISYLVYSVILVYLYRFVDVSSFITDVFSKPLSKILIVLFESVFFLMFLFFSYRVMHYLLKVKIFERLFVYTSLTKYSFWRRYRIKKVQHD